MKLTQNKLNRSVLSAGIALTLGLAAYQANAALTPFPVSFTTQSEATVVSIRPLDFGAVMGLSPFGSCTLTAVGAAGDLWLAPPFTTAPASSTGITLSGAGCLSTTADAGIYIVTGTNNSLVKITLTSASGADFDFAPAGHADPDSGTDTDGVALAADTQTDVTLVGTDAGIVVGGVITIGATPLTPGTAYTMDYNIELTF